MLGIIYILDYHKLGLNNNIKIGSTKFPHFRLQTYQTGMFSNLKYTYLYRIENSKLDCYEIDDLIQQTFLENNWKYLYHEGGQEWYKYPNINNRVLEQFFIDNKIEFSEVKLEDCPKDINKNYYYKELEDKQNRSWNYGYKDNSYFELLLEPFNYQQKVLDNLQEFTRTKKGKILWACGLGKTYMSLFICHKLKMNKILICVPTLYLVEQFYNSVKNMFGYEGLCLHQNGDNIKIIKTSLENNKINIIISTYHSAWKLEEYNFDIKIGDESHHLVSEVKSEDKKSFDKFHNIKSNYTLFMTATEKNIKNNRTDNFFTMSNEEAFGCLIDKKSVKWAIENKKITDYEVVCLQNSSIEIKNIMEQIKLNIIINKITKDKIINKEELFFAAYSALKMISEGKSYHILVYTNKCYSADIIESIIDSLLENNIFKNLDQDDIYNKSLTSKKDIILDDEILEFKTYKYGIIPCVYIFGEGVDIPKLDSVIIAEKMTTEIRIVQSCLRPNRLNKNNPDKKAKIIIPLNIGKIDDKLKIIINHLANEDDIVEQKIQVFKVIDKKTKKNDLEYSHKINMKLSKSSLNKIILDLYKSNAFGKELTLQKEFELYQEKVLLKGFKTVKEYQDSQIDNKIEKPDIHFNGVWTNWFDFLGIYTTEWIDNILNWKKYCQDKGIKNTTDYYEKLDESLPPEPEYYYPNFKGINKELGKKKYRFVRD